MVTVDDLQELLEILASEERGHEGLFLGQPPYGIEALTGIMVREISKDGPIFTLELYSATQREFEYTVESALKRMRVLRTRYPHCGTFEVLVFHPSYGAEPLEAFNDDTCTFFTAMYSLWASAKEKRK